MNLNENTREVNKDRYIVQKNVDILMPQNLSASAKHVIKNLMLYIYIKIKNIVH